MWSHRREPGDEFKECARVRIGIGHLRIGVLGVTGREEESEMGVE